VASTFFVRYSLTVGCTLDWTEKNYFARALVVVVTYLESITLVDPILMSFFCLSVVSYESLLLGGVYCLRWSV
jgi:hypothetical protein